MAKYEGGGSGNEVYSVSPGCGVTTLGAEGGGGVLITWRSVRWFPLLPKVAAVPPTIQHQMTTQMTIGQTMKRTNPPTAVPTAIAITLL